MRVIISHKSAILNQFSIIITNVIEKKSIEYYSNFISTRFTLKIKLISL